MAGCGGVFFPFFPRAFAPCRLVALVGARQTAGKARTRGPSAGGLFPVQAVFPERTEPGHGNARSLCALSSPRRLRIRTPSQPGSQTEPWLLGAPGGGGRARGEPPPRLWRKAPGKSQGPGEPPTSVPPPRAPGTAPGADPVPTGAGPGLWGRDWDGLGFCLLCSDPLARLSVLRSWYSF